MKSVRIFTDIDLDGEGVAIVGLVAFNGDADVELIDDRSQVDEKVRECLDSGFKGLLIIGDLPVSRELALELNERGKCLVFDHHETALEELGTEFSWVNLDMERCSTKIMYDYLLPYKKDTSRLADYDRFVSLVNDHDLWIHNYLESSKFNTLLAVRGHEKFRSRMLLNSSTVLSEAELMLLDTLGELNREYLESKMDQVKVINLQVGEATYKVGCVIAEKCFSSLGNKICDEMDVNFALVVEPTGQCHLRAITDGVNLGLEVASKLGGGGHALSAGCSLTNEDLNISFISESSNLIKSIFERVVFSGRY